MEIRKFEGIYPAVITPFDSEGQLAEAQLIDYLDFLVPRVDGLWLCGSYGSAPIMTLAQRKRVAELSVKVCRGRIPIIVHIGCPDTESSIGLAQHAENLGVEAVAAVTPFYYRHTEKSIVGYYQALLESVEIPLIVYNNPKYSNFSVSAKLLADLAERGIQGVKDSSGDISLFYDYLSSVKVPDFLFLIGSQTHLVPAVVGGAHGCVSGLSNAFPEFVRKIYTLCRENRFQEAVALQKEANKLRKLTGEGIPVPFYHAVLPLLGINIGLPRAPFVPLAGDELARIQRGLTEAGMLQDRNLVGREEPGY